MVAATPTCTGWIEPLNLNCMFFNIFAGTAELFLLISFIALAAIMGRFKMRNETALLLAAIYGIMFSSYMPGLYLIIVLLGGMIIFFSLKAPFSRN